MGLYDVVEFDAGFETAVLDEGDVNATWQTKEFDCVMRTYRITKHGVLMEEKFHTEKVPEEERPFYGTEKWEEPILRMAGSINHVTDGWEVKEYTGWVFIRSVERDEKFKLKFVQGVLRLIRIN